MPPVTRRARSLTGALLAAAVLVATSVSGGGTASSAAGDEPVRYQEPVFTDLTTATGIEYGQAVRDDTTEVALLLDLYQPAGDTATNRPAIVWVHGGGFSGGNRTDDQAAALAATFARLGYVTVSIDYRLRTTGGCDGADGVTPECQVAAANGIADGQAAVRWLRANAATYRIDTDRIGIGGISAGGIVATGVGLLGDQAAAGSNPGQPSTVRAFASVSGGLPPGPFATADDAPGILFSGTADDIVPYAWSRDTAEAMAAAGVEAELVTFTGSGHVPFGDHGAEIDARSIDFFFTHLATEGGQPSTTTTSTTLATTSTTGITTTSATAPAPAPASAARPVSGAASYTG
jgi:acetyl esterase/lipase